MLGAFGLRRCLAATSQAAAAQEGSVVFHPPGSAIWAEKRLSRERLPGRLQFNSRVSRERQGSQNHDKHVHSNAEQRRANLEITRLGRERRWQEALVLFASVPEPDAKLRTAALTACTRSLELHWARQVFDGAPERTVPDYNTMIALLGRLRRIDEAEEVYNTMRRQGLRPTSTTFGCLIGAYGMARDLDAVMRTLEDMRQSSLELCGSIYASAMAACARVGAKEQAQELLSQLIGACVEPNVGHFTSLIASCAQSQDEPRAREAFAELRRRGLEPDLVAYTSLMACLAGSDALAKAETLLAEASKACLAPDATAYNQLLQVATRSGDAARGRQLLAEMAALGLPTSVETRLRERQLQALEEANARARSLAADGYRKQPSPTPPTAALPAGWREALDPASGHTYYWREADPSGSTTWLRPQAQQVSPPGL